MRNCAFATDSQINADPTEVICESYKEKTGSQRLFSSNNPLELVVGSNFYSRKNKLFDSVVGFAKFSEYLVVAEVGYRLPTSSIFLIPCTDDPSETVA